MHNRVMNPWDPSMCTCHVIFFQATANIYSSDQEFNRESNPASSAWMETSAAKAMAQGTSMQAMETNRRRTKDFQTAFRKRTEELDVVLALVSRGREESRPKLLSRGTVIPRD